MASGYDDMTGMQAALEGIDTLFLVSASEHPRRVELHIAAVAAGVTRIVYAWVTTYAAIAAGEFDAVSDAVARVAGREPISLDDYLGDRPDVVAGLGSRVTGV